MNDLAEFIRGLTPDSTEKERRKYVSNVHLYGPLIILFAFVCFKSVVLKIVLSIILLVTLLLDLSYKDCPLTILEREFSKDDKEPNTPDILDKIFEKFEWKLTRNEKISGFTGTYIGVFLVFSAVTVSECFSCLFN